MQQNSIYWEYHGERVGNNVVLQVPKTYAALVSCDGPYFLDHGPAFLNSCAKHGMSVHINMIDPQNDGMEKLKNIKTEVFDTLGLSLTWTLQKSNINGQPQSHDQVRAYYASSRYYIAKILLELGAPGLLISDIDAIAMRKFTVPEKDVAVFFRDYEQDDNMKVAAGLLHVNNTELGRRFVDFITKFLDTEPQYWFVDQRAISYAVTGVGRENIGELPKSSMDWEFDTVDVDFYTAKGARKTNPTYLSYKEKYIPK